jgi:hypothetical protein
MTGINSRFRAYSSSIDTILIDGPEMDLVLVKDSVSYMDYRGGFEGSLDMDSCRVFDCNIQAGTSNGVYVNHSFAVGTYLIGHESVSLIHNSTLVGSGLVLQGPNHRLTVTNSIISTTGDPGISLTELFEADITINCSDIWGFDSAWIVGDTAILDTSEVLFVDPLFCDTAAGDFRLSASSPCVPANNDCAELIGALSVGCDYVCGDADYNGGVDIDDVVYLISYIFVAGPEPLPYESGDADCSGGVDIDDVVYLIAYIFSGGPAPCDTDGDGVPDCWQNMNRIAN